MADSSAAAAAAPASSAPDLSTLTAAVSSATLSDDGSATLSRRGEHGANTFQLPEGLKRLLANMYDPDTNPQGIINAGIADNSLCRDELLRYLLAPHRLQLSPADLTYADRFTTSTRLLEAIAKLFNEYTPDWPDTTRSPKPRTKVVPDHIAIASGATGILDELFWNLCDEGDGVLLSTPYYNAFDNDLTSRAKAQVVRCICRCPTQHGRVWIRRRLQARRWRRTRRRTSAPPSRVSRCVRCCCAIRTIRRARSIRATP